MLREVEFATLALAVEAGLQIARLSCIQAFANKPDTDLQDPTTLLCICEAMESTLDTSNRLVERSEEVGKLLDHTNG